MMQQHHQKNPLNGQWQMRRADDTKWYNVLVPGTVHTDLLAHNLIADPFFGNNELELQDIDRHDYLYQLNFDVADDVRSLAHLELVFAGLDTYADVTLNGTQLLSTDNMFRSYRAEVTALIKPQHNLLTVYFHSPVNRGLQHHAAYDLELPAANDQSELGGLGNKKVSVFTRKAGYHYGWDWGPRFVTSGIFRQVYLEARAQAAIDDVQIMTSKIADNIATLDAIVTIQADQAGEFDLVWSCSHEKISEERRVSCHAGINRIPWQLKVANPKLWWCHTHGTPHLYHFEFALAQDNQALSHQQVTTGIRTLELQRTKDDKGASFQLVLNGTPVFAKGANYIPNDNFITRTSHAKYQKSLEMACDANMNTLRIWGGGFFEEEFFYDLCDRYGMLVWHDLMFACSLYPDTEAFAQSAELETIDNIKRLRNHACIALWCGNNEIDVGWGDGVFTPGWGWRDKYDAAGRERVWGSYKRLFHERLAHAVRETDPSRPYWPSSPSADYDARACFEAHAGDVHYWGVWHANHPLEAFNVNVGRFMSEYGFQSFPDLATLKTFTHESDRHLDSTVIKNRQRCPNGTQKILDYMQQELGSARDFMAFLPLSQLLQARALKTAIEAHRRAMPYCMGSLYWQLNDCWPTMSWSSIDYNMRAKGAHFHVKKAFAPLLVSFDETAGVTHLTVVSDLGSRLDGHLTLKLMSLDGRQHLKHEEQIVVESARSQRIYTKNTRELLQGLNPAETILTAELTTAQGPHAQGSWLFVKPRDLQRPKDGIHVDTTKVATGFLITLSSTAYHHAVYLQHDNEDDVFDDNYFELIPSTNKQVLCTSKHADVGAFAAGLKTISLLDLLTTTSTPAL